MKHDFSAYNEAQLEAMGRFLEVLLKDGDNELTLLKGHLLIEEKLNAIIVKATKSPEFIPRLPFKAKAKLARSLVQMPIDEAIWNGIDKLNEARNELSHSLAHEKYNAKVEEFIQITESKYGSPASEALSDKFTRLHFALYKLHALLSSNLAHDKIKFHWPTLLSGSDEKA